MDLHKHMSCVVHPCKLLFSKVLITPLLRRECNEKGRHKKDQIPILMCWTFELPTSSMHGDRIADLIRILILDSRSNLLCTRFFEPNKQCENCNWSLRVPQFPSIKMTSSIMSKSMVFDLREYIDESCRTGQDKIGIHLGRGQY